MSFERGNMWGCDFCTAQQFQPGYGLPPGWKFQIQAMKPVVHWCRDCVRHQACRNERTEPALDKRPPPL
jgi:hypothetical protein